MRNLANQMSVLLSTITSVFFIVYIKLQCKFIVSAMLFSVQTRFFYEKTGLSSCEIIPGDGSLVRSQGINGRYFNHWFIQRNEEQVRLSIY